MKTLKFFSIFFVVMTLFALTSYSQGNVKTTIPWGNSLTGITLPGVPETVTGSFSGIYTVWDFKWQWKANGSYIGDDTGTKYYTSVNESGIVIKWIPGKVKTNTSTIHIKDENGNVYYNSHYNGHMTISANGEITSKVSNGHEFILD